MEYSNHQNNEMDKIKNLFENLSSENKKKIIENLTINMYLEEINKKYEESLENNKLLLNELEESKIKLRKYTAPARNKKYYETHKEEIKVKVKERAKKNPPKTTDPELRKIHNKKYYEKKKNEKFNTESENQDNI